MTISKPTNNTAKILAALISKDGVNERMYKLNGFRARLSEIRIALAQEGIRLRHVSKDFKNEFGRAGKYFHHFLINSDKRKALEVYKELNK